MRAAFDIDLMRPGCVLVAAAMGATPGVANRFNTEDWLLIPTPGMQVFEITKKQLNVLLTKLSNLTPR